MISLILLAVAYLLVVAGVACWSVPAALVVAGVLLGAACVYDLS